MKYVIILADGMADLPIAELNGKTPMEAAKKNNIDKISGRSMQGMVNSIPDGMEPGSDVANLSILGYDPKRYYSGRSGIEAAGRGIELKPSDLSLRTNLVTLEYPGIYEDSVMTDHGADDISSEEAYELIDAISQEFGNESMKFYKGISYRHLLVLSNTRNTFGLTPPHDILGRKISGYMPAGKDSELLIGMMKRSYELLSGHKINKKRVKRGLHPANSIWFWGAGTRLSIPDFNASRGLHGGVISAVDLVNGIGMTSGMKVISVKGANGTIDTDYSGKAQACINELRKGLDFIYLHVEAPDECGHKGDFINKIRSIELIDQKIVGPILESGISPMRLMFLPDHPTPVSLRTHSSAPVPFLIYDSVNEYAGTDGFTEKTALESGIYVSEGYRLLDLFIG
jgi:2,3-bisphosphoglycerate-independent phosphoglycerate mutase